MTNKKNARRALVSSIISLLLCVSMLVSTTFAWFTDEVVSGMNTIAAGNLDVELLADGTKVESSTKLFDDVKLWEPGVVAYENLQVANVGTLALKYQMTLNFGNENDLNGHKLSEVLKVAVIDKVADGTSRATVLAAAKAAIDASQSDGSLGNFYLTGELEANTNSVEKAVVIFWDANDDATDNLYNANNGQTTSDGQPLHIEFGVNLQATQKMSESDSFDNKYDEFASILPKATVNTLGAKTITATTSFPNGTDATEYDMDIAFQFLPNESLEQAQSSQYRYWHADYVISADKDVPANSIALAGYYQAFCKDYNNDNWVLLSSSDVIPAGTEIRLVQILGNGGITVNYENICEFGNDGVGFMCGATDLTGENVGTTITVELRLYETTKAPDATSGTANEETGNYEVVGTYSYTFGAYKPTTAEQLQNALGKGVSEIKLGADINMNGKSVQIPENGDVTIDLNGYTLTSMDGGTGNNMAIKVNRNASLTLNDSVGTGKIVASCYGIYVQPGATLIMNGGEINVSGNGVYDMGVIVWNGKFVMNDGAINAQYAVWTTNYWKANGETTAPVCEVTINDNCEIESTGYADIDIVDAPDTILNVPETVVVYKGE